MSDNKKTEEIESFEEFREKRGLKIVTPVVMPSQVIGDMVAYRIYKCRKKVKNRIKKIFKRK